MFGSDVPTPTPQVCPTLDQDRLALLYLCVARWDALCPGEAGSPGDFTIQREKIKGASKEQFLNQLADSQGHYSTDGLINGVLVKVSLCPHPPGLSWTLCILGFQQNIWD